MGYLLKGTKVKTPYGFKNIEDLVVGENLMSHVGVPVKIININSQKIYNNGKIKQEYYMYTHESNSKIFMSYNIQFQNSQYKLEYAHNLKKVNIDDICNDAGFYEIYQIHIYDYDKYYLIVNGFLLIKAWDGIFNNMLKWII